MRIGVAQLFSKQVNSLSKMDHNKLMRWLLHEFLKTTLVPNEFIRRTLLPILFSMLTISITMAPNVNLEAGETLWMRFQKLFLSHMDALIVDKGLGDRDYCELYREECALRITALYYCVSFFKISLFLLIKILPCNTILYRYNIVLNVLYSYLHFRLISLVESEPDSQVRGEASQFVEQSYNILCALFDQRQVASNCSRFISNSVARSDGELPGLDALQISTVYLLVFQVSLLYPYIDELIRVFAH